jgi:hypothetical protein
MASARERGVSARLCASPATTTFAPCTGGRSGPRKTSVAYEIHYQHSSG